MKKLFWSFISLFLILSNEQLYAGWSVGNGGDSLRVLMKQTKQSASHILLKINEHSLSDIKDSNVKKWILENKKALAIDIMLSEHSWVHKEESTCAWSTGPSSNENIPNHALIEFSFPTCRKTIHSVLDASTLLIHESVHHFGITSEQFADDVAMGIINAWKNGKTEWIKLTASAGTYASKMHSAIWTGSKMIVYGGLISERPRLNTNKGFILNPTDLSTTPLPVEGAPARHGHKAIWTGKSMLIWGGFEVRGSRLQWQNNGALLDMDSGKWTKITYPFSKLDSDGYVETRIVQTLVWTGKEAIIYGGLDKRGEVISASFNPVSGQWKKLSQKNALLRKWNHSAVLSDKGMIVFGGVSAHGGRTNEGAIYNIENDRWDSISSLQAPSKTEGHSAVVSDHKMIVFAGFESSSDLRSEVGIYDIRKNKWTSKKSEIVLARVGHSAVWTGFDMLIFGGKSKRLRTYLNHVASFEPEQNQWKSNESLNAPTHRFYQSAIWTGSSMIIWGGQEKDGTLLEDGGIYYP